jgi:hypothetical protein
MAQWLMAIIPILGKQRSGGCLRLAMNKYVKNLSKKKTKKELETWFKIVALSSNPSTIKKKKRKKK